MRWTDKELDALDRQGQISALGYAKNVVLILEQKQQSLSSVNQQIEELKNKAEKMKLGLSGTEILVVSILFIIAGSFIFGFCTSCSITFFLFIGYMIVDKVKLSAGREQRANQFFQENYPPLGSAKNSLEEDIAVCCKSDGFYNVRLLLPDEYLSSVRIQALIDILNRRRARTISDAMTICENIEHQKRIEYMEEEKLKAAKEAAEAQKRAAIAAENTEKRTRQMAEEQKRQAREAARIAQQQQQYQYQPPQEKRQKRATKLCYKCKMEIPAKATICPYCHSKPNMTDYSPVQVFFDKVF